MKTLEGMWSKDNNKDGETTDDDSTDTDKQTQKNTIRSPILLLL